MDAIIGLLIVIFILSVGFLLCNIVMSKILRGHVRLQERLAIALNSLKNCYGEEIKLKAVIKKQKRVMIAMSKKLKQLKGKESG